MKAKEIRELTTEEITQRILDNKKDVQHLRFQNAVAGIENPAAFRRKRRETARLKTILGERELNKTNAATSSHESSSD
ncbi:MAG: 50S ribosomal protein L29 [Rhodothermia bacterium]